VTTGQAGDVLAHPGVRAWLTIDSRQRVPALVEVVKGLKGRRTVWRLAGAGPGGSAVIAKRCPRATAALERQVYERVLPRLPVSAPGYYGYLEDGDFAWIFLEDVGRERIAFTDDAQRRLAGRWLGTLHAAAVGVVAPGDLPDRGLAHYRRLLAAGRASVEAGRHNPALTPAQRRVVEAVLGWLDAVEGEWGALEQFCGGLPETLVHGDFRPRNLLVLGGRTKMRLCPIDWELAGWGLVAPDLAPLRGPALEPQVDPAAYVSVARQRWPDADLAGFREQVTAGSVLRWLAAVEWAAQSLAHPSLVKPVGYLNEYVPELLLALAGAPWRRGPRR